MGLLLAFGAAEDDAPFCQIVGSPEFPLLSKEGDVMIGGAFSIHSKITQPPLSFTEKPTHLTCSSVNLREFRFAQTMIFAIEEINRSEFLLPSVSIGYRIYDNCGSTLSSMRAVMALMNGDDWTVGKSCSGQSAVHAIIGESESSSTIVLSRTTGPFKIPVISHSATCECLSSRQEYPSFFRTIASDLYQSRALAQLVKHFGWTWVGAVNSDSDYGNNGMAIFLAAAQEEGVCIEYTEKFHRTEPEKLMRVVDVIQKSTAQVIVGFLAHVEMNNLLQQLSLHNITDKQFVGVEAWITADSLVTPTSFSVLGGSLGFAMQKANISGLDDFLIKDFWETEFKCKETNRDTMIEKAHCKENQDLIELKDYDDDVAELRYSSNIYKAIYAVAHSLHSILKCSKSQGCDKTVKITPWQVVESLKQVNFTIKNGDQVWFDSTGAVVARYEVVNWQLGSDGSVQFKPVGYYDASLPPGQKFVLKTEAIMWRDGQTELPVSVCSESCRPGTHKVLQKGKPVCCYDCIPCAEGEVSTSTDSNDCKKCPEEYWSNQNRDACVLKNVEFLYFTEVMGRPSEWSCMLRHTAFGITFVLCISCVLGKTVVVLMAFKATLPEEDTMLCEMLGSPEYPLLSMEGDITIGGAFSIHSQISKPPLSFTDSPEPLMCSRINFREFRFAQTMIFAIEEINKSSSLLPNISIGYKVFDSCGSTLPSTRAVMGLMNGQERTLGKTCSSQSSVHAIIGASESSSTIVMLQISGIFQIPVISHFATCACLSNRKEYPSFFRTIPSDYYQSRALEKLVKHFGWTWVGAVRSDNDYGNNGMATFITAASQEGVCIEYSESISRTDPSEQVARVVRVMQSGSARVVVAFLAQGEMDVLLEQALNQNLTGLQWVGSESWITAIHLATKRYSGILTGSLGFAIKKTKITGLQEFLLQVNPSQDPQNNLLREFWEATFGCSFQSSLHGQTQCSGSERLQDINNPFTDVSELRISNNVYKAVYAVAHALHNMLKCGQSGEAVNQSFIWKDDLEPKQVVKHLQNVNFTLQSGESVYFDENGDPAATYELVNWQRNKAGDTVFVAVGSYNASQPNGKQFTINGINITWAAESPKRPQSVCSESCLPGFRQAVIKGKPICCFSCIACAAGEISNFSNSTECSLCPLEYWSNEDHSQCVPKVIEFLSYGETMGALLTAFSLFGASLTLVVSCVFFRFRHTPLVKASNSELSFLLLFSLTLCFLCSLTFIGRPSEWSCMLRHTAFGITFALCMSCILAKTMAVVIAFKAKRPANTVPQCSAPLQRTSVLSCTLLQVLVCVLWLNYAPPHPYQNTAHATERIILECDLGSPIGFWAVLGYIGLLAVLCFILAFLARKLPDNFNEAKFITFSMLIFCAVWITFIPAYVSSPGKFTVAVEIFAILASSFGLLFCIFAPKCYILLLKPERNTKKHMMGRNQ
ncbi:extracellular calcium-sensing receptor-like isoform X2 [Siniperca chuatsi]|uniref:extracellular calcium-sensing receptor-like isoform X2 n=1 Tax=Siniperca chuatsi TaxID=119488 RepID=UPI001CE093B7|nr:extracellular calcium-sensing receptor-like isoform X2 [Siniperca chuatsi]